MNRLFKNYWIVQGLFEKLPASVLKCQLLLECFEQMGEEELIREVKNIVNRLA